MFEDYTVSLWGLWLVLTTILIQAMVATIAHRKQKIYIPGVVDTALGHESFVFRSDRTFRNSLENIVPFLGMAVLAIFVKASPALVAVSVWVYALARIVHMYLYYSIATEKNPSPRSYFYMIGLLANFFLVGVVALALFY